MELLKPFMQKVHEVCLIRGRDVFVSKYSSLLKHLRDLPETRLVAYLENSWSHRIKEWAAFGRVHACVSTSMLCERFHKRLKHDILQGKPNVRIDSLVHLLIALTVETEEEREILKERGVLEGRYRLQQHHRWHKAAVDKYATQQD
ncbi:unnamed protein product [Cylicocyclus nassatus]|uniref:Uncharacterized protein n=1 Tax=Cylicocyclus nassatus TaxID=53992 RepID=A0AA36GMU8_CYLNA|nr:unnamed protein product [Cylicocyclus nassatus]